MSISKENKEFIDSLIEYYISESESYKQIAENFKPEVESIPDTAFGIITGCVYSGFLQAYQNQQQTPSLEDMDEFNQIIKKKAVLIKKSIIEPTEIKRDIK
ncbi:hypothetical protein OAI97_01665 [Nitrosopumilus sp.]|nr:hypothetical protein [Nitrosopumilus sp.]